jgi:hypothetical protein
MANRNWASGGKIYSMHVSPVLLDCNFVVDSANGNGLGLRSLKGPAVANVYMHTSASPAPGNPNPAPGTIIVQMADNYNKSFSGFDAIVSPVSGSSLKIDNSALIAGAAYIITTLGNATPAQFHALGVPAGVVPAVGVSFVANSVGAGPNTSSSRVMATAALGSGVCTIETVGDPNLSISPKPDANQGYGAQFILQCRDYQGAVVAPTDGSVISLAFYLSNSSITVQGE